MRCNEDVMNAEMLQLPWLLDLNITRLIDDVLDADSKLTIRGALEWPGNVSWHRGKLITSPTAAWATTAPLQIYRQYARAYLRCQ
jgi:hypothetical protein